MLDAEKIKYIKHQKSSTCISALFSVLLIFFCINSKAYWLLLTEANNFQFKSTVNLAGLWVKLNILHRSLTKYLLSVFSGIRACYLHLLRTISLNVLQTKPVHWLWYQRFNPEINISSSNCAFNLFSLCCMYVCQICFLKNAILMISTADLVLLES